MSEMEDKCNAIVGISYDINGPDYGRIMRWEIVSKDGQDYYVFVFSSGKRVEANSLFTYIKKKINYPQGSDYAMKLRYARRAKHNNNGGSFFGPTIRNIVYLPKDERK